MKTKTLITGSRINIRVKPQSRIHPARPAPVINLVPSLLKLKKILVPVDFSDFSKKALHYALPFAEQFDASITLLHVVEPVIYPVDYAVVPPAMEDANLALAREAREKLARLGQENIEANHLRAETIVVTGHPYQEITRIAKERNIDLIILATHGYTGLKHVYLGSTAERVVRHAPCPVLTVRDREREFV